MYLKSGTIIYSVAGLNLKPNSQNINMMLTSSSDADETKLNNYLYKIELATRELIKDINFNQLILTMAK